MFIEKFVKLCRILTKFILVCFLLSITTQIHAANFEMREYFGSLGSIYPVQDTKNLWTFHYQDNTGALLPSSGLNYYQDGIYLNTIGIPINSGDSAWRNSFYNNIYSYPTFDGVFVHSGYSSATAAVFHAPETMNISEIKLFSETVVNGEYGNGFNVTVNSVINNVPQKIDSFIFNYPTAVEKIYTPSILTLQKGDMIEILYDNNGTYLYDHGNVNAFINSSVTVTPEPSSMLMLGIGLFVMLGAKWYKKT